MTTHPDPYSTQVQTGNQPFGALWPALVLAVLGLFGLAALQLSAADGSGQYLVVTPPWRGQDGMMAMIWRAEGSVAGLGALPSVAIVMADQPDFAARMRQQGAWLVIPSPRILGCSATDTGGRG